MTELPPSPPPHTPGGPSPEPLQDPRAAQFLATEHWSLLASRSMTWNEAFSRTGTFLSTLSAAIVALALAGPAMQFDGDFRLFALVVLAVALFLGIATFVRLVQVNNEDMYWVYGMNRLRAAYARLVPGIEREFVSGYTLDAEGVSRSFAAINIVRPSSFHALITTPALVGVVTSAVAGAIVGLLATELGSGMAPTLGLGIVTFVVSVALCLIYGRREAARYIERMMILRASIAGDEDRPRSRDVA
jgi:hypothetical protein